MTASWDLHLPLWNNQEIGVMRNKRGEQRLYMGSNKKTFDDRLCLLEMSFVARGMGLVMLSGIIGNPWGLIRVFDLFRVMWSTCPLGPA